MEKTMKHPMKTLVVTIALALGAFLVLSTISGAQGSRQGGSRPGSDRGIAASGAASVQLSDGRVMTTGGIAPAGVLGSVTIRATPSSPEDAMGFELRRPRAWHTATLLPDGKVLILGGVDGTGRAVPEAEILDPQTGASAPIADPGLAPRSRHSATLLTDGRVLIWGGVSGHSALAPPIQLWNSLTRTTETLATRAAVSRREHRATLLADGTVLVWGGRDPDGRGLDFGEVFDPASRAASIEGADLERQGSTAPTYLAGSYPADGAREIPLDALIALRFSKPIAHASARPESVRLSGPAGELRVRLVLAGEGRLLFVHPDAGLTPGSAYLIETAGLADTTSEIPPSRIHFTTASGPGGEEAWSPDTLTPGAGWRSGRPDSPWRSLPPLSAPAGTTALAGQVLALNGQPLADVTLRLGSRQALSDSTGRFLLPADAAGHQELLVDGRTASRSSKHYGIFEIGVDLRPGSTTALSYTIWMPLLDTRHEVSVELPAPVETVITTPLIPGLEVRIPPYTALRDHEGHEVTRISITPIPVDRTPFPLPEGINVPVYFTIQPGGAYAGGAWGWESTGVRLVYPNYRHEPAGAQANFWHYDPEEKGWFVYGHGKVTTDGTQVDPNPGVAIYEFTGAMINFGNSPPPNGPPPCNQCDSGDPVDLGTGLFVMEKTDLFVPDTLPLTLRRTYRQGDTASRPFGIGSTHPYAMFLWSAQQYQEADLILPDGGRVHYVRISPGTGFTSAIFEHTGTPSRFYKSLIAWNGNGWDLTLKDGTVYVFGDEAPLQSIRDRYGNRITLTWSTTNGFGSGVGNITKITSPGGRYLQFTYDLSNRITQVKDNIGRTVIYTYDASGRLSTVKDPLNQTTTYTYDASHRMLTIKDPKNIVYLTNQYDANGRVTRQTQADNTFYQYAYTLDGSGRVTQTDETNPRGFVRRVTFNTSGYTTSEVFAQGRPEQQTLAYQRQAGTNLLEIITDPLGRQTQYTYDSMGNLTSATQLPGTPQAAATTIAYEPTFQQPTGFTDPSNRSFTFGYDVKGNLTSVTDGLQNQTTLEYNSIGQLTAINDPLTHRTTFAYDGTDLKSVTDPLGRTTTRFTDAVGRLINETDAAGRRWSYEYDALNRITRRTDPLGGQTNYTYDANGNMLTLSDAKGNVTTYTYDNMDRVTSMKDPMVKTESYVYDAGGNMTKFTDRRGKATGYNYDPLGRLVFTGFGMVTKGNNTTYTSTIGYAWDAGDRLTTVTDSVAGTTTLGYDTLDRQTSMSGPQGSVTYTYDLAGRRASMTASGQSTVSYTYDDAGRLTRVSQGASNVDLAYDAAYRNTSVTLPNGVVIEYTHDVANQVTGIAYRLGQTTLGNLTYDFNAAGEPTSVGGSFARFNLPTAVSGNLYNAANRLTKWGAANLSYDLNGNLTGDGTNTYVWSDRNQLASISGGVTASMVYDGFGRRTSRTVSGASTQFLYDSFDVVQEQTGGSPTANLLTGLGIDDVYARTDASGTRYLLPDALGSTLALTDSGGALSTQYTYEPFGKATASGPASTNTYQFTGRENDGTGLQFNRSRYYSPKFQRFISEDTIGFAGGDTNLYAYVGNSPLYFVDPAGYNAGTKVAGKIIKLGVKGFKTIKKGASFEELVRAAREGFDVICKNRRVAREVAQEAGDGLKPIHEVPGPKGRAKGHRPHYHPNPRNGAHVFYSVAPLLTLSYYAEGHGGLLEGAAWIGDLLSPLSIPNDILDIVDEFSDEDDAGEGGGEDSPNGSDDLSGRK